MSSTTCLTDAALNHNISTNITLLILSCLLFSAAAFSAELEPYFDEDSSNFSLPDLEGVTHAMSDYKGKVVLVNFWASWCMPCILEMPELTQLKQHMARQPFEILAVNVGERKNRVKQSVKRINFKPPVLLDISSEIFNKWNIKIMPTSFLVDANGFVRYRALGNPGWDNEQTLSIIGNLIKEAEKSDNTKH